MQTDCIQNPTYHHQQKSISRSTFHIVRTHLVRLYAPFPMPAHHDRFKILCAANKMNRTAPRSICTAIPVLSEAISKTVITNIPISILSRHIFDTHSPPPYCARPALARNSFTPSSLLAESPSATTASGQAAAICSGPEPSPNA